MGVIDIPDLHDFERKLVGSRDAISELWKLMRSPGKELQQAAARHRELYGREPARRKAAKKPPWPRTATALFTGTRSVRAKAVIGEDDVDRTILPERLAKACGAEILPVEVSVFLEKRGADGDTDWDRSAWVAAHPALVWIALPRTRWKAPILAAVVPTTRCPMPHVGKDWLADAVERRHEKG